MLTFHKGENKKKTVCLIVLFFDTVIEKGKHQNVLKCFYKEVKATE